MRSGEFGWFSRECDTSDISENDDESQDVVQSVIGATVGESQFYPQIAEGESQKQKGEYSQNEAQWTGDVAVVHMQQGEAEAENDCCLCWLAPKIFQRSQIEEIFSEVHQDEGDADYPKCFEPQVEDAFGL